MLGIPFRCATPEIDETARLHELAKVLVTRLSENKAKAVHQHYPKAVIIAGDQVAELDHRIFGKPLNRETAIQQLQAFSGRTVYSYTGLCVMNTYTQQCETTYVVTKVRFRTLSDQVIGKYLDRDQPFNCSGSTKIEGTGITLFKSIESTDHSAITGLPMITLIDLLEKNGIHVF